MIKRDVSAQIRVRSHLVIDQVKCEQRSRLYVNTDDGLRGLSVHAFTDSTRLMSAQYVSFAHVATSRLQRDYDARCFLVVGSLCYGNDQ